MFGKKVKKLQPYLTILSKDTVLYDDFLSFLPFKESVILEKSIAFFQDKEPCFIHRNAVRVRLLAELEEELQEKKEVWIEIKEGEDLLRHLKAYVDLPPFSKVFYTLRQI